MSAVSVIEWVTTWGPLVTLSSTVLLAIVTAWLAYVTKVMADSAKDAAVQSRIAAEASLASVAAAEASVDVRFDAQPSMGATAGEMLRAVEMLQLGGLRGEDEVPPDFFPKVSTWRGVRLTCRGATVTVHGLRLVGVSVQDQKRSDSTVFHTASETCDIELVCVEDLPRMAHTDEVLNFQVENRTTGEEVVGFTARVSYSFGIGEVRAREVTWKKSPVENRQSAALRNVAASASPSPTHNAKATKD
jgi:hypothetical protein